jgi:hypothetical protein
MGKNGRILFDRPKPTAGCSASGRRRRRIRRRRRRREEEESISYVLIFMDVSLTVLMVFR